MKLQLWKDNYKVESISMVFKHKKQLKDLKNKVILNLNNLIIIKFKIVLIYLKKRKIKLKY